MNLLRITQLLKFYSSDPPATLDVQAAPPSTVEARPTQRGKIHPEAERLPSKTIKNDKKFTTRLADRNDLEAMAELFGSHNYGPQKVEWLRWKYFDNPDGPAKIFIGEDPDGKFVALRAHMPRYFVSEKTGRFFARNSVDMFVANSYRGTGVYTAVWELCRSGDYPIVGFPNKRAKKLIANLPGDVRVDYPVDEWWYPVVLGKTIRNNLLQFLEPALNLISRCYSFLWLGGRVKGLYMQPMERFVRDYSFEPHFIQGVRTAEFLNWRFIDNPMRNFSVYGFFDNDGANIGYCVFKFCRSAGIIYDLVLTRYARGCLKLLVEHFREKRVTHIIFKCIGFKMRKYGFVRIGSPGYFDVLNTPQGKWKITMADKD
jgi:hypothetical protein